VKRLLERHPDWTLAEVAVKAEVSERTVSRIRNAPAERAKPLTAVR
jgi:DNA-binding LacI/PurR family transcriptional regulator